MGRHKDYRVFIARSRLNEENVTLKRWLEILLNNTCNCIVIPRLRMRIGTRVL